MKKDNIELIRKIDGVTSVTDDLKGEVRRIKEEQSTLASSLEHTQQVQTDEKTRVTEAIAGLDEVSEQVRVLQGLIQKQDQKLFLDKLAKEKDRSREIRNNLFLAGLDEMDAETETTTAEMVTDFFTQTMKIAQPISIDKATRIGQANPKTVLIQLADSKDKGVIFKHVSNLKEARNSKDKKYSINNQLTPEAQERERKHRKMMKHNESLAGVGKRTMELKKGRLLVDGHSYECPIKPPSIKEMVFPLDISHVNHMVLWKGEEQKKDNCVFIGYGVEVFSLVDIRASYSKVKWLHPSALHIACAYRLPGVDHTQLRGYVDDDEYGAGSVIYSVLEEQNIFNRAVFVVGYYGNKHLGKLRFQLVTSATKSALKKVVPKHTVMQQPAVRHKPAVAGMQQAGVSQMQAQRNKA